MKKLFLLIAIGLIVNTKAQTTLGMSTITPPNLVDTVNAGSTHTYTVWVKNLGTQAFSDTLSIYTAVADSMFGLNIVNVYNSNSTINIAPADSAQFTMTEVYNVSPTGYKTGIDVIVVWPVAQGAITADSLTFNIFIVDATGIKDIDLNNILKLYPNPTAEKLTIDLPNNLTINSIRLIDMQGKESVLVANGNCINVENIAKGNYILNIELSNKKQIIGKFIKQ
ncbi:MAG: T9SS type A sorting domain-containing protein [Bacteroidetes bacterium]|jgi:hypothetical protein|nr:T9SS type A sorting domain-containing protein [Bacteroidota bacterium]